ncbi:MAG: DUF177 domain-containing protein [Clostridiales bacterium]|nr:DUF177 domain-containing protein [Clostridiales bacterium]
MLLLELGRLKHDAGFCLPLDMSAVCDPLAYEYKDMPLCAPLALRGTAENVAGEIQVTGELTAAFNMICSRCGAAFPFALTTPFREIYSSREVAPDEEGELDKHIFGGVAIDLTPEALRALFAELPMKPLCREDCLGLCPQCGADLNRGQCSCATKETDPRWEKLRELFNDEAGKGV